jgi:hypothetical protein
MNFDSTRIWLYSLHDDACVRIDGLRVRSRGSLTPFTLHTSFPCVLLETHLIIFSTFEKL